jgi:hypothetical protein
MVGRRALREREEKKKKKWVVMRIELVCAMLQSEFDVPNCGICRGELKGQEKKKKKKKKNGH